jgi:hypothetical protein
MRTIRLSLLVLVASALAAFTPATFGVFHNETDSTIVVTIVNTRGESSRAHSILPHDAGRFPVMNGTAIARTTSGKTLARCNLMPLAKAREYYDFPNRSFYYRVTHDRIEFVRPESARKMAAFRSNQSMKPPTPERDRFAVFATPPCRRLTSSR